MLRVSTLTILSSILCACAGSPRQDGAGAGAGAVAAPTVTLPLQSAWHNDRRVFYISTDISDAAMATMMGSNFAPRLADAVPALPRAPADKSALERVYKFSGDAQDAVFASSPDPIGPTSADASYSPLWQVFWVTWRSGQPTARLTSEEAILAAEERGAVDVVRTGIVINCPVIGTETGALPGAIISR